MSGREGGIGGLSSMDWRVQIHKPLQGAYTCTCLHWALLRADSFWLLTLLSLQLPLLVEAYCMALVRSRVACSARIRSLIACYIAVDASAEDILHRLRGQCCKHALPERLLLAFLVQCTGEIKICLPYLSVPLSSCGSFSHSQGSACAFSARQQCLK